MPVVALVLGLGVRACSTPEGIGAVTISTSHTPSMWLAALCSTPEGIGAVTIRRVTCGASGRRARAQRPKASER